MPSFAFVMAYIIATTWSFWAYWLWQHDGDLQNASVPFFAAMVLIGTVKLFEVPLGYQ
jgi:hypothetical protein